MPYRALVHRLFFGCRPAAVSRLVVAVVVDSINGPVFRSLSHVGKKIRERHPSFAYRDSSASPSGVVLAGLVGTSLDHTSPRIIGGSASRPWVATMLGCVVSVYEAIGKAGLVPASAFTQFDRLLSSHVITSVMSLVRSQNGVSAPSGFAILAGDCLL